MPLRTVRYLLAAALGAAALASVVEVASADSAARAAARGKSAAVAPVSVEVELAETVKGKAADGLHATLTIGHERGCASVTTDGGTTGYELKVCREGGDAAAPLLSFEVSRIVRGRDASSTQHFRMSSTLAAGQRIVVGKLALGDVATELAAKVN